MIQVKKGDTLTFSALHTDDDGIAINLDTIEIAADITLSHIRESFTIVKSEDQVAQPGQFAIVITDAVTSTLPVGTYACDLKYTEAGTVSRTDTFSIEIIEAVTL